MTSITTLIVQSIRREPSKWKRNIVWLEREDGVSLVLKRPFSGKWWRPRIQIKTKDGSICFQVSAMDGWRLKRAWNQWRTWAIGEDWK